MPLHCDDPVQQALVTYLLERHPAPVHVDELARAFREDDWESAASALLDDGLLHREGALWIASRAAVRGLALLG